MYTFRVIVIFKYIVGLQKNLRKRIIHHNSTQGGAKYTKLSRPFI